MSHLITYIRIDITGFINLRDVSAYFKMAVRLNSGICSL